MNHIDIRRQFDDPSLSSDEIFKLLRSVAYFHQRNDTSVVDSLDLIIRLIDQRDRLENVLAGSRAMIDAIARQAGLYPYVQGKGSWRDELAVELMRAPGLSGIIFHIEQALVFHKLAEGRSIILSAPTSFGKSLLIDALIAHRHPKTVVAVVPTIALLDEFRRRMSKSFPSYQVITRSTEVRASEHTIYVGTQERLLERKDLNEIDLFIIDEFYKLDLDRNDQRSVALNAILAKHGRRSKQIYLLGPSIDEVPNLDRFRDDVEFIKTRYSPVTADIIDRSSIGPNPEILIHDLRLTGKSSSLIYVQSPLSAFKLTYQLMGSGLYTPSSFCADLGEWMKKNFHPEWVLGKSVQEGIGIHHGRVPRAIAHLMISLFDKGELGAIVCTSSMIEGVNTAAENVFIYDKNISTSKLDRFTFDNIKGRAGRMFQHKIGRVYLYNAPPDQADYAVKVPLFEPDELMVPELLVQLDDAALSIVAQRRKRAIADASRLPTFILATWAEFGVDQLNSLAADIEDELLHSNSALFWKGIPTFDELRETFEIAWNRLKFPRHDIRTPRQLALFADRLRKSGSTREFLDGLVNGNGLAAQPDIDRCFNFLRGAEYTFPQILRAMNDIVDVLIGEDVVNYRVYAAQLQALFLPGELRALDEFGVPLPLIEKLAGHLDEGNVDASRRMLADTRSSARQNVTDFEAALIDLGLGV
jgi:hypothetical protein